MSLAELLSVEHVQQLETRVEREVGEECFFGRPHIRAGLRKTVVVVEDSPDAAAEESKWSVINEQPHGPLGDEPRGARIVDQMPPAARSAHAPVCEQKTGRGSRSRNQDHPAAFQRKVSGDGGGGVSIQVHVLGKRRLSQAGDQPLVEVGIFRPSEPKSLNSTRVHSNVLELIPKQTRAVEWPPSRPTDALPRRSVGQRTPVQRACS